MMMKKKKKEWSDGKIGGCISGPGFSRNERDQIYFEETQKDVAECKTRCENLSGCRGITVDNKNLPEINWCETWAVCGDADGLMTTETSYWIED